MFAVFMVIRSVRTPAAGKRGVAKAGRGSDQVRSEEGATNDRDELSNQQGTIQGRKFLLLQLCVANLTLKFMSLTSLSTCQLGWVGGVNLRPLGTWPIPLLEVMGG